MSLAEEQRLRRMCRELYGFGPRPVEEFLVELARHLSWRTPLESRLETYVTRLRAVGGRPILDRLGVNEPMHPPVHVVRSR